MGGTQAHSATGAAAGGHGTHLEDPQRGRGAAQPDLHEALPSPSPGGEAMHHPHACCMATHICMYISLLAYYKQLDISFLKPKLQAGVTLDACVAARHLKAALALSQDVVLLVTVATMVTSLVTSLEMSCPSWKRIAGTVATWETEGRP